MASRNKRRGSSLGLNGGRLGRPTLLQRFFLHLMIRSLLRTDESLDEAAVIRGPFDTADRAGRRHRKARIDQRSSKKILYLRFGIGSRRES